MFASKYSAVAIAMLTVAVSACSTNPSPLNTMPSTAPTSTTANPTAGPSSPATETSTEPTGSPTAAPASSNPGAQVSGKTLVVSGRVYDESGAPVDGASIQVNSLDPNVKYSATVKTAQGSYVINTVPEGVNVEVVATKDKWTKRRRVGSFQAAATVRNEMNFGSAQGSNVDDGSAYFISHYPEVSLTEPAYKAKDVAPGSLTYKLTLSEPLDETNRRRFEDALRIFPANKLAAPVGAFKDLQDVEDTTNDYNPDDTSQWAYSIKKGALFLNDADTRASVTWDATNTVATLTFNAPLITDRSDSAKYQVGLVAGSSMIVDADGNALGTDKSGAFNTQPAAGNLLRHVFVPDSLSVGSATTSQARWAATHQSVSVFSVIKDDKAPVLKGVAYTKNLGTDSRFELTFDKAMAAYDGTSTGRLSSSLSTGSMLDTLTFAVSDRAGGTDKMTLHNTGNVALFGFNTGSPQLASASDVWGSANSQIESEFKLDKNAFTTAARSTLVAPGDRGKLTIEVNPTNPKMVFIYAFNRTNLFDAKLAELKARLEGAADPAGNAIRSSDADANQVTASF